MSLHPSLKITLKARKQRSVLKRIERIKHAIQKGTFNEQSSVYGLPKIKSLKIKVKKEKAEEKAAAPAAGAKVASPAAAKTAAKGAAPAKKA